MKKMDKILNLEMVVNMPNLSEKLFENEKLIDKKVFCTVCEQEKGFIANDNIIRFDCYCNMTDEEIEHEERVKQYKKDEEELKEQDRLRKQKENLKEQKKNSNLPLRYQNAFINTVNINAENKNAIIQTKNYIKNLTENIDNGYGIYIYGNVGSGKTHLACCILNECLNNFYYPIFTNMFEIANKIKSTFNNNDNNTNNNEEGYINKLSNTNLLIIDDLGTEDYRKNGGDNWLKGKLYDIINKRYNNMKSTIFTSNLKLTELVEKKGIDDKIVSRIVAMSNSIINIEASDFRLANRKA